MTRNSEDSGGAERVGVVGPCGFRLNKELDAESDCDKKTVAVTQRAQITDVRRGVTARRGRKGLKGVCVVMGRQRSCLSPTHSKPESRPARRRTVSIPPAGKDAAHSTEAAAP
jgi:hypothetical protein